MANILYMDGMGIVSLIWETATSLGHQKTNEKMQV